MICPNCKSDSVARKRVPRVQNPNFNRESDWDDGPLGCTKCSWHVWDAVAKRALPPENVTLDLVLRMGDKLQPGGFISTAPHVIMALAVNHKGEKVQVMLELHADGAPEDWPVRFLVYKLAPTVWKVAPSLTVPGMLHAYLTLVGVPSPAPWESTIAAGEGKPCQSFRRTSIRASITLERRRASP